MVIGPQLVIQKYSAQVDNSIDDSFLQIVHGCISAQNTSPLGGHFHYASVEDISAGRCCRPASGGGGGSRYCRSTRKSNFCRGCVGWVGLFFGPSRGRSRNEVTRCCRPSMVPCCCCLSGVSELGGPWEKRKTSAIPVPLREAWGSIFFFLDVIRCILHRISSPSHVIIIPQSGREIQVVTKREISSSSCEI